MLLSNRSAAYAGLQQFKLALQDSNACIEADETFVKGYSRQGHAHAMLHQPGFAEAAYRKGLQKEPQNPGLKQNLAQLLQVERPQADPTDADLSVASTLTLTGSRAGH